MLHNYCGPNCQTGFSIQCKYKFQSLSSNIEYFHLLTQMAEALKVPSTTWAASKHEILQLRACWKAPEAAQGPSRLNGPSLSSSPARSLQHLGQQHITQPALRRHCCLSQEANEASGMTQMSLTATDLRPPLRGTSGFKEKCLQERHFSASRHPAVPLRTLPSVTGF